ncbi:hypothetical protein [Methylobacterium nodulans]|uniref:Uncharacterized protein n=1 Tax=Methylobacterium nodulans (strain LMG 21967 / CNCM I-2342 / ORS 2060) TaxID=460265 RepID=B8INY3_METNO|nr:hypothetical protein [Methylobacterium nodulans]ACL58499.1 conserved hypothetical protein [Methylobacterium nodulans ORS 2060]
MRSDLVDLTVEIARETDLAVLVHEGDKSKAVWLPKSVVEIVRDDPMPGLATITLPERVAVEKGLV